MSAIFYQCCRVIQDTQSNVQSAINTDVTDNQPNNHGVYTTTNEKTNKQTISYKRNKKQQYIKTMMIVT